LIQVTIVTEENVVMATQTNVEDREKADIDDGRC
jgi:hypothetical protein